MSEPVTQAFLISVVRQSDETHLAGHGRLRASLNELKTAVSVGMDRISTKIDMQDQRTHQHSERLLLIENLLEAERQARLTRKQDARDQQLVIASLTSVVVTVALFAIKAWFQL